MNWLKQKKMSMLVQFLNIFFALYMLKQTLRIQNFNYIYLFVLFLISVFIYYFYDYVLKTRKLKLITSLIVFVFIIGIIFLNKTKFLYWLNMEIKNMNRTFELAYNFKITQFNSYKFIFIISFLFVIPLVMKILNKFNYLIIILNYIYINVLWFLGYDSEIKKSLYKYLLLTLFSISILVYIKRVKKVKNGEKSLNKNQLIIYSLIISIVIAFVSNVFPKNFHGKRISDNRGKITNKFSNHIEEAPLEIAQKNSYNLRYSGYSNNEKKLGGKISIDNKIAFEMLGKNVKQIKYLRGIMKNNYSGTLWKRDKNIRYIKEEMDYTAKIPINVPKKTIMDTVEIQPKDLKTTSIMLPLSSMKINNIKENIYYDLVPTCMISNVQYTPYNISFMKQPFETVQQFKTFCKNNEFSYTNYYLGNMKYNRNGVLEFEKNNENLLVNQINEDKRTISIMSQDTVKQKYINYLRVPKAVPKRVYDLTYKIIENCKSNEEKAIAIMNYLDKNYKYDLNVSDLPKDRDFVDYFLFDEKKGYCTYFATTSAIMCRIAGLPSRYIEGFKVDSTNRNKSKIEVTNKEAHAWCEILIDPQSDLWLILDPAPTPLEYENKNRRTKNTNINTVNIEQNSRRKNNKPIVNEQDIKDTSLSQIPVSKNKKIIMIFSIILIILLINLICRYIKINNIVNNKSIIPLYMYLIKRLKSIKIQKKDNICDMEFAQSIKQSNLRKILIQITNEVYREYYGNVYSNNIDKKQLLKLTEKEILNKSGKIKYYFKKFLCNFGIIF